MFFAINNFPNVEKYLPNTGLSYSCYFMSDTSFFHHSCQDGIHYWMPLPIAFSSIESSQGSCPHSSKNICAHFCFPCTVITCSCVCFLLESKGEQKMPLQNMSFWHMDHFERRQSRSYRIRKCSLPLLQ